MQSLADHWANWVETQVAKSGKEYRPYKFSSENILNKQTITTCPGEDWDSDFQNWCIILLKIWRFQQKIVRHAKKSETSSRGDNIYFLEP